MQPIKAKIAKYSDLKRVKTKENKEELINISDLSKNITCAYEKFDMVPYTGENIWVRKTLADKLQEVANQLHKINSNYKLKIVYGYRHPDIQEKYFNNRKKDLNTKYSKLNKKELEELIHSFVAMPEIAGHPTGGAIDLTITTKDGDLDMGTKIADYSDEEKIKTFSKNITLKQKKNRLLLHDLMTEENFAPFYGEWWHFSYGDKEWAWFYKKPNAIYGQIEFQTKKNYAYLEYSS